MKYLIHRNFSSNINSMSFIKKDSVPPHITEVGVHGFQAFFFGEWSTFLYVDKIIQDFFIFTNNSLIISVPFIVMHV
jgi:hypothetical protein